MTTTVIGRRRGGPLIMLGMVLGIWVAGRAALWESPFAAVALPSAEMFLAEDPPAHGGDLVPPVDGHAEAELAQFLDPSKPFSVATHTQADTVQLWTVSGMQGMVQASESWGRSQQGETGTTEPIIAAGHSFLMAAAFRVDWSDEVASADAVSREPARGLSGSATVTEVSPAGPARFLPLRNLDRWSLDAFAFYRQGSGSTAISQGRVPVYGASQAGANLQYRIDPGSGRDPRAFVRAYRAFVPDGENEIAAGVSARVVEAIPVRLVAELRVSDNRFGTETRPAAYAVTELPIVNLPFDIRAEAYGGAGYVGGSADTPFVDGQAFISREIASVDRPGDQSVRFSIGGSAWGGAQRDASRLDVGPSARVDLTIGRVPARLSVDWRERVAGDAEPNSGIAATLSTRF